MEGREKLSMSTIVGSVLRIQSSLPGPSGTAFLTGQSSEPSSPQPSFDRLSVSFAPEEKSGSETSWNMAGTSSPPAIGGNSVMRLSVTGAPGTDEDDDYSASVAAVIHRRASTSTSKKPRGLGKRRTSSPFDSDRRRSSAITTSSAESTAITMEGQEGITQEEIFENIRLHKEVLESVKQQPWEMRRKIKLVQQAKEYVRRHEGHLQERLAQSKSTKDAMASFNFMLSRWWQWLKREFGNFAVNLIPWELRIKEIESHFGSVVASYFTFLRWVFWINIVMTSIIVCLIIVPEILAADHSKAGMRKEIQDYEKASSHDLSTLWDFEGILKYSPMFYGYYTNQPRTKENYPLPLSYFLTGLGIYVYSFVAILRRMAKNSRQSKLSEKEDECIFSWKVFTGWDYMIGNPETAFNRFASITMGFKEALLEEKEKKKDERNWKVVSLRVLANLLVMMLLCSSAWAVMEVVERSKGVENIPGAPWWRQNEITLAVSLITTVFPNLFEVIGMLEKYHPRRQLRWQLGRIMVLNFLNLFTLMFALFGKVSTMTVQLQSLRPPNVTGMPSTIPAYDNFCVDVPVNCSLLNEFRYNETVRETTETLTFLITTALMTKYEPNGTLSLTTPENAGARKINESLAARFNQKEWWDILHSVLPTLDRPTSSIPDLIRFQAKIDDKENLTLFTPRPGLTLNDTLNMIPGNTTTLKIALPLLMKLVVALVPKRSFRPKSTQPLTTFRSTMPAEQDIITTTFSNLDTSSTDGEVTTESNTPTVTVTSDVTSEITTTREPPTTSPVTSSTTRRPGRRRWNWERRAAAEASSQKPLWRNLRDVTGDGDMTSSDVATTSEVTDNDSKSNNLILGRNGESSGNAMSTRGDIPGDTNGSGSEFVTRSTTPMPSSTSTLPPDDSDKLLTTIDTLIKFIARHNTSRTDWPNLSTVDEYAQFVTTYHSRAETQITRDPFNSSFTSSFQRESEQVETSKCYVKACENGTIDPPNFIQFLNCSDLTCAMEILARKTNESTTPQCVIPGSRSCMTTEPTPTMDPAKSQQLGKLCWETMFGQELVKLTVMDLIFTVAVILVLDFLRAILVRILNPCWCWDLEKKFPQYGDFKIAENILHLVNNQGMIWMGLFFSPGLPAINLVKLIILMYIRSWTVMTCNVPHETVFRASRSNNFYFALLLFMLFLCVLPVGYAIVWLTPSWHCGPFSDYKHIYYIFTTALKKAMPECTHDAMNYIASPGIIIPLLVLLVLVIYYLLSLTGSLREANNDLKIQLRRERTEERRKMFKMAGGKDKDTALSRWQSIIPTVHSRSSAPRVSILTTGKQTGFAGLAKRATLKARELSRSQEGSRSHQDDDGSATDVDISQVSLPEDIVGQGKSQSGTQAGHKSVTRKPSTTDSLASRTSEIPLIKISREEDRAGREKPPRGQPPVTCHVQEVTKSSSDTKAHVAEGKPTEPIVGKQKTSTSAGSEETTETSVAEPSKRERIIKALISRARNKVTYGLLTKGRTDPVLEEERTNVSDCGSPVGSFLNQEHLLDMEAVDMDIHPFFVRFQTGFESQESKE